MAYIAGIRRVFRLDSGKESVEDNVDEELHFHFEMATQDLVARGWSAEDARREVLRRFGDVEEMRSRLREIDHQLVKRRKLSDWAFGLWQDVRYAVRGLRRRPGFCAGVILTLALGIGANSAMFGIIDRLLLRPPAYMTDPAHTHRVYLVRSFDGVEEPTSSISYRRYLELQSLTRSFSQAAAFWNTKHVVGSGEAAREMQTGAVSASYFDFFSARPVIGRFFTTDEDRTPDGSSVAVLGNLFWRSRYGGRVDALGSTIQVAGRVYTIIGVAPPGFSGVSSVEPALFVPITSIVSATMGEGAAKTYFTAHNMSWMEMLVRRKPSVSVAAAASDLTVAYRRSYIDQRAARPSTTPIEITKPHAVIASVLKERGPRRGDDTRVAIWLLGVTAIVFLIACANVANLLLTRMFSRRREIAIRLALGVSRMRLLQQLMTESIMLAILGGAAGLLVAQWIGSGLRGVLFPETTAAAITTSTDSRVLLFTGVSALAAGILIGLAPALQTMGATLAPSLRTREGNVLQSRARVGLLVLQAAFSVVLLVGAGLFVRSLRNVRSVHLGYDPQSIVFVSVEKRGVELSEAQDNSLRERMHARARELPGVISVSPVLTVPFWMTQNNDVFVPGVDTAKTNHMEMDVQAGSSEFFRTVGTRIIRGRGIEPGDNATSPKIAVVSARLAKALWPGRDPIGQCMKLGADTVPCTNVVGIAEDTRSGSLKDDETYMYYLPIGQTPDRRRNNLTFIRVSGSADDQKETVRRELQRLMPGAAFVSVLSLAEIVEPNYRPWTLGARMFAGFGLLAVILAAIGLYSVISFDAKQRTPEIGIRIALGAQPAEVVRLVMAEGGRFVAAGTVIGCAIALALGRWVQPLLFDTSARDPLVFGGVIVTLLAVAACATFIPARRATRVDPSTALRAE